MCDILTREMLYLEYIKTRLNISKLGLDVLFFIDLKITSSDQKILHFWLILNEYR